MPAPEGTWAWRRGTDIVVALNLGPEAIEIAVPEGTIALSTGRDRDGERVERGLALTPSEGAILAVRQASAESSSTVPP
jgi:alpha-glucosidase